MRTEKVNHVGKIIEILSSDTLADVVIAALREIKPLSIVRMSDGEEKIRSYCNAHAANAPMLQFGPDWGQRYGITGITCGEMGKRLDRAATECTYYAPDGGEEFFLKHYAYRPPFAEIYFPHRWSRMQRQSILKLVDHVLVINADHRVAKRMEDSPYNPGVEFDWFKLNNWTESENAIKFADGMKARLVFVSGGPASKYIAPVIAKQGNGKVVLDMGSGAPHFWCTRGHATCPDGKCGAVAREQ